jgi:hypothetical protein
VRPYLENIHHKKELVEWLKVKVLSLSSSTTHTQKKAINELNDLTQCLEWSPQSVVPFLLLFFSLSLWDAEVLQPQRWPQLL